MLEKLFGESDKVEKESKKEIPQLRLDAIKLIGESRNFMLMADRCYKTGSTESAKFYSTTAKSLQNRAEMLMDQREKILTPENIKIEFRDDKTLKPIEQEVNVARDTAVLLDRQKNNLSSEELVYVQKIQKESNLNAEKSLAKRERGFKL